MSFSDDVRKHTKNYRKRMDAVFTDSVQELVDRAQTPQGKGGRLPKDTGFLQASGGSALDRMPSGPTENETGDVVTGTLTGEPPIVTLAKWRPGRTVFFGWSAAYSRAMEFRFGFMRSSAEKWQEIVAKNAARAKALIK